MADYQTKMPEKNFKHTLSVIIPVYNEEKTILKLIDKVRNVKIKGVNKEIIVVDDYSSDGTRDVLKRLKDKSIKSVFHNKNWGKGKALKTGISSSSGDFIIFQDADFEYEPNDYKNIIKPLINGEADFVLGQRIFPKFFSKNNKVPMHILGNKIITLVGNTLYSKKLKDYEPSYKAFKSSLKSSSSCLRSIPVNWLCSVDAQRATFGCFATSVTQCLRSIVAIASLLYIAVLGCNSHRRL